MEITYCFEEIEAELCIIFSLTLAPGKDTLLILEEAMPKLSEILLATLQNKNIDGSICDTNTDSKEITIALDDKSKTKTTPELTTIINQCIKEVSEKLDETFKDFYHTQAQDPSSASSPHRHSYFKKLRHLRRKIRSDSKELCNTVSKLLAEDALLDQKGEDLFQKRNKKIKAKENLEARMCAYMEGESMPQEEETAQTLMLRFEKLILDIHDLTKRLNDPDADVAGDDDDNESLPGDTLPSNADLDQISTTIFSDSAETQPGSGPTSISSYLFKRGSESAQPSLIKGSTSPRPSVGEGESEFLPPPIPHFSPRLSLEQSSLNKRPSVGERGSGSLPPPVPPSSPRSSLEQGSLSQRASVEEESEVHFHTEHIPDGPG